MESDLKCHALFEDGHIVETSFFGFYLFSGSYGEHVCKQFFCQFLFGLIFHHAPGIEINPVVLLSCKSRIAGDLHGGYRGGERCSAACGEEYDLSSGHCKCRGSNQIVAWCAKQM